MEVLASQFDWLEWCWDLLLSRSAAATLHVVAAELLLLLRQRLDLGVHGVHQPLLVPLLLVHERGEAERVVLLLPLLQLVEQDDGGLGLDADVLGRRVAVVGQVGAPIPRDEQVQELAEVAEGQQENALLKRSFFG